MSKQDDIRKLLDDDDTRGWKNTKIAQRVGCDEGTVRRARNIWEAENVSKNLAQTGDFDAAETILANLLAVAHTEDVCLDALEEIKDEIKEIKSKLKLAKIERSKALVAAKESFPLWEKFVARREDQADEQEEIKAGNPKLAGVG